VHGIRNYAFVVDEYCSRWLQLYHWGLASCSSRLESEEWTTSWSQIGFIIVYKLTWWKIRTA
jgi:hypothetical protein